ncbi:MAG: polyprenyl synthetase family protein [Caldilineales bacterium]|nr:polyprenyl synthetase family protein [Caldilineales bacterium]
MIDIKSFTRKWLPVVETHMRQTLSGGDTYSQGMWGMMRYHLGWEDERGYPDSAPQGKRVRPLVVLMSCQAAGSDPAQAIPAAAAVELLHNFSLIHDDIEDNSPTRRHRPTLWTWAGVAQAINAGDAMFTLARLALLDLSGGGVSDRRTLQAVRVFDETSLRLTEGQYMDISFETRTEVGVAEYLAMIAGKTAALLAASAQLGAIVAGADEERSGQYWRFGHELGVSFQIQDDILGIWGDEALTGKSAASDILTRKKTLPVLYALSQSNPANESLRQLYARTDEFSPADVSEILDLLAQTGAREHAEQVAEHHAQAALQALAATGGELEGTALLRGLAMQLLGRAS